jgi:CMP-N-acetylneuraminic acid synthetase
MTPRVAALVPMRHDSERVPGKNYRPLGGQPLFHHIVRTLLETSLISKVVIDTDSNLIRDDAKAAFPGVEVLGRPEHLRGGTVPMNDVLLNDVRRVDADIYLQTHSTNPLLRSESIRRAIEAFLMDDTADSLFGVTRLQTRLWAADGIPLNHDRRVLVRTQDLPVVYEENSCIYLFTRSSLERNGSRIGEHPILFEVARDEAWDIDAELDFEVVEALYERRRSG